MGFWDTVANVASAVTDTTSNGPPDRLCRELGWKMGEYRGHNTTAIHFSGDHITPRRTVLVSYREGSSIMVFACVCRAEFSEHTLPDELLGAMLIHNEDVTVGAWHATVASGPIRLVIRYMCFVSAVNAETFKAICEEMVKEVAEVEAGLRRNGLL